MADEHDPEAFAEKLRYWREQRGLSLSSAATPSRRVHRGAPRDKTSSNAWERGIAKDERGVPILMPGTLEPMPIKHYVENRHRVDAGIRENRQSTPNKPKEA